METQDLLKKGIGTQDKAILKPAKVKIVSVTFKTKTNDGKEMKTPLAEINCKHPDKEELIAMTKIKIDRNSKLEVVSTWIQLDDEGNLQKSSAISQLLGFLNAKTLEELYGKDIEAVEQSKENSYLCLKAY